MKNFEAIVAEMELIESAMSEMDESREHTRLTGEGSCTIARDSAKISSIMVRGLKLLAEADNHPDKGTRFAEAQRIEEIQNHLQRKGKLLLAETLVLCK